MIDQLSQTASLKLQVYFAAQHLFAAGYSYPQVIGVLTEHVADQQLLHEITEKARLDEWDQLHNEARTLFASGKFYDDVLSEISSKEDDPEIVHWICNNWYDLKVMYAELVTDWRTSTDAAVQGMLISIAVIIFAYGLKLPQSVKIISLSFLGLSVLLWFIGRSLMRGAKNIEMIFTRKPEDLSKKEE